MKKLLDFLCYVGVKYNLIPYEKVPEIEERLLLSVRKWANDVLEEMSEDTSFIKPSALADRMIRAAASPFSVTAERAGGHEFISDERDEAAEEMVLVASESFAGVAAGAESSAGAPSSFAAVELEAPVLSALDQELMTLKDQDFEAFMTAIREEQKEKLIKNNPKLVGNDWTRGLFKNWLDMAVRTRLKEFGID